MSREEEGMILGRLKEVKGINFNDPILWGRTDQMGVGGGEFCSSKEHSKSIRRGSR